MKRKLFSGMCLLAVFIMVLAFGLSAYVTYEGLLGQMRDAVRGEGIQLASLWNAFGDEALFAMETKETRITLIAPDGTVRYDSQVPEAGMENHAGRTEIAEALEKGYGESTHVSLTLGQTRFYVAIRLSDGSVLRVSSALEGVLESLLRYVPLLLGTAILSFLLALVLARWQTKRIVGKLNGINLEQPLSNDTYEELSPLLGRLEQQNRQIAAQIDALSRQREEFSSLAENMREGMIWVDEAGAILTINQSAMDLLGLSEGAHIGTHILALNRSMPMQEAVTKALGGVWSESLIAEGRKSLQLLASPIFRDGAVTGAILLLLDVTERREAEEVRRTFSANVSHELKTPLTSISGYAELMKEGMVDAADMQEFAARIYLEARRLVLLVEDIIKISRLDEGMDETEKEPVELLTLGKEAARRLESAAEQARVEVAVSGDGATILGAGSVLEEMIYNLLENAIKYNKENGSVRLTVENRGPEAVLTVEDTGIGIPKAHQERVFQRFYRVDKGRSRDKGGTGLGLSIVKHGAQYHNAGIQLNSTEGVGTTIKITFQTGGDQTIC